MHSYRRLPFTACLATAVAAATACADRSPVAPPGRPQPAIVDSRNSHQEGFYFRFPISRLSEEGDIPDVGFNPDLSPTIRFWNCGPASPSATGCTDPVGWWTPVGTPLTLTSGTPLLDRVVVLRHVQEYLALWNTKPLDLDPGRVYRLEVLVGGQVLGSADVDVVRRLRDLLSVDRDDFVGLVEDGILPIPFWIGDNALRADVVISRFAFSPTEPTDADLIEFEVDVSNIGTTAVTVPFQVDIVTPIPGSPDPETTSLAVLSPGNPSLEPGETITLFTQARRAAGTYTPTATADPNGVISESDEGNNSLSSQYTVLTAIPPGVTLRVPNLPSTITVGGSAGYDATVLNGTGATITGVIVQGFIDQGGASDPAGGGSVHDCAPGSPLGALPPGTCTNGHTLVALGDFVPGEATARIEVRSGGAVLASFTQTITLIVPEGLSFAINLSATEVPLGGATPYDATLTNATGATVRQVSIATTIEQGGVSYDGGSLSVVCFGIGEILPGSCTQTRNLVADDQLALGAATAHFTLKLGSTNIATTTRDVTIVPGEGAPNVSFVVEGLPGSLPLGGVFSSYVATLTNTGGTAIGVVVQGTLVQGSRSQAAGGASVHDCAPGAASGTLPTGTCANNHTLVVPSDFAPGPATARIDVRSGSTILATLTQDLTLTVPEGVTLDINLSSTSAPRGLALPYVAVATNPTGMPLRGVSVETTIEQGGASVVVGGGPIDCGSTLGTLLKGTCNDSQTIVAPASAALGAATARFVLRVGTITLATVTRDITITSP
jgi:hypothetical protein